MENENATNDQQDNRPQYSLSKEQKLEFASTYLLERMIRTGQNYPLVLQDLDNPNVNCLKDMLDHLYSQGYTTLDKSNHYVPSDKGQERIENFRQRYSEYIDFYVVYSRVDLKTGEFAFEKNLGLAEKKDLGRITYHSHDGKTFVLRWLNIKS